MKGHFGPTLADISSAGLSQDIGVLQTAWWK